ncbi:MAG: lipoyl synthase [Spirochaetota bacterium]
METKDSLHGEGSAESKKIGRRPAWLKKKRVINREVLTTQKRIQNLGLSTVCEHARCPNISECFGRGAATFMILGDCCTRNCGFCSVHHTSPQPPEQEEGLKIAGYIRELGINFCVITSVTRDDLPDGGSCHFKRVVEDIRRTLPRVKIELLVPDFKGDSTAIERIMALPIQVVGHNMETVRRLYRTVRQSADYDRSLTVLQKAADIAYKNALGDPSKRIFIKSGTMVGLGESKAELKRLFSDLTGKGVKILTIGQYLQPTLNNLAVVKYYSPDEFDELAEMARAEGIPEVVSGPYVRSSYKAEESYNMTLKKKV